MLSVLAQRAASEALVGRAQLRATQPLPLYNQSKTVAKTLHLQRTIDKRMEELSKNGFSVIHNVFSSSECLRILDHLSNWEVGPEPCRNSHLMSCPAISAFANDKRLIALASTALSEPAIPYRATLFEKSPKSNWLVASHGIKIPRFH
jgi:hypothetical protein